jgi:hypothetical protein
MLKQSFVLASLAVLGLAPAAYADSVQDSTSGVVYTLEYAQTATANTFDVYLTIDASGYDGPNTKFPNFLNDVALQLASQDSDYTVTVLSAPTGYATTVTDGGLGQNGCNASGNGFYCLEYTGTGLGLATAAPSDVYQFEFSVFDANGLGGKHGLFTDDSANVEANYLFMNTNNGNVGGNKDNDAITMSPTPEPSSLMLLGTGVLGAAGVLRRRLRF